MGNFFKLLFGYIKFLLFFLFLIILLIGGIVLMIIVFNGKIYIEVLIILILICMVLSWRIWLGSSRKKLIANYKPEKDMTKKLENENENEKTKTGEFDRGRESYRGVGETDTAIGIPTASVSGLEQPQGREFLQTANVSDAGKTSDSNRKNGRGIRKLLGRGRRRRRSS